MAYALVAFDLDGTLLDTETLGIANMLEFLQNTYNLTLTPEHWHAHYHGMAGPSLLARLNADHGTDLNWDDFAPRRFAALEQAIQTTGLQPAPGMLQMLRRVLSGGQQICLASNSSPTNIQMKLAAVNGQRQHGVWLPHVFDEHTFSANDPAVSARRGKPEADIYHDVATYYRATPALCLALEDSVNGLRAAVAAGFEAWGYTGLSPDPVTAAEALRAAGASRIITHWDEFNP